MDFLEAAFLGIIQGLTEFLPISSSAHLRITALFLPGADDPGATFTAITQIGTELAVIVYFWGDITRIIGRWFSQWSRRRPRGSELALDYDADVRMGWLVILGSIPIAVAGFLLQDIIRSEFRSLWIVAIVLVVFGVILGLCDRLGKRVHELRQLGYRDGLLIGVAQALALVPGVSRSGATTSMGLALGYTRPAAAKYGFLLAIPAVFGSGLYELVHAIREPGAGGYGFPETLVATVLAFVVGLAVVRFLMRWIQTHSFMPFVVYRIALGGILLIALSFGWIQP
ncbi:undecaprenyl-diphosphate phosphatase [Humidisolicoccus flavus]|uniref:undecaprenyl-diphosphate phosphatase n=1 Tax=Humidisolicoccus flavus TaxID=3111414 RepID=UPI00324CAAE3